MLYSTRIASTVPSWVLGSSVATPAQTARAALSASIGSDLPLTRRTCGSSPIVVTSWVSSACTSVLSAGLLAQKQETLTRVVYSSMPRDCHRSHARTSWTSSPVRGTKGFTGIGTGSLLVGRIGDLAGLQTAFLCAAGASALALPAYLLTKGLMPAQPLGDLEGA